MNNNWEKKFEEKWDYVCSNLGILEDIEKQNIIKDLLATQRVEFEKKMREVIIEAFNSGVSENIYDGNNGHWKKDFMTLPELLKKYNLTPDEKDKKDEVGK